MVTKIKSIVEVAIVTLGVFSFSMNASANRVLNMPMMASPLMLPDGEGGNDESVTWIEVTLESAGSLGVEVMYKVDQLADVDYLKVTGTLNAADWTSLKNMSKLQGLDLRQTQFDNIPNSEFDGRTTLSLIYLPEGMKTIGNYAFRKTSLTSIDIPASVTSIGVDAFYQAKSLTEVSFPENSILQTIGESAFNGCTALVKFLMPNTVTSLGNYSFWECNALTNLSLSTALTSIPYRCFSRTSNLKNVVFPEKLTSIGEDAFENSGLENVILPINLTSLGNYAFGYCNSLKYIELPSYVSNYFYTFYGCKALTTVVCPSCTPPTINNYDPFSSVDRSKITLKVPSFAVVDYKLDSYWLNFGTIEAMETDPTYIDVHGKLSLTNNRRPGGIPNMTINTNSSVIVGGNEPFEVGTLNFVINRPDKLYGKLLNRSSMTVQSSGMSYYVQRNKWYFLSPFTNVPLSAITHSANASFVFRYYNSENRATNGATNNASWQNVTESELKAGQGYIFQCNQDGWIQWTVEGDNATQAVNSASITTMLTDYASENAANANWNYVGNPYPCYYDAYYMDFTAPITVWDYNNNTYKAYSVVDDNYILHPMESFFVQKPGEVDAILFKEEGRQIEATTNRVSSARTKSATDISRKLYDIQLTNGTKTDETRAIINENASLAYEIGRDAAKFMTMESDAPQVFTIDSEGNNLAFNERPLADGKIRLGIYVGEAGVYMLKMSPSQENVQLYDAVTGKTTSLSDEAYHFAIDNPGFYTDRFTLSLAAENITAIGAAPSADASIAAVAGGVEVRPASATEILVYGTDGRQVAYAKAVSGKTVINLPAGLYVVKVGNKAYKCIVE